MTLTPPPVQRQHAFFYSGKLYSGRSQQQHEQRIGTSHDNDHATFDPVIVATQTTLVTTSISHMPCQRIVQWNAVMAMFHGILLVVTLTLGNIDLGVNVYKTQLNFTWANETAKRRGLWSPSMSTREPCRIQS